MSRYGLNPSPDISLVDVLENLVDKIVSFPLPEFPFVRLDFVVENVVDVLIAALFSEMPNHTDEKGVTDELRARNGVFIAFPDFLKLVGDFEGVCP